MKVSKNLNFSYYHTSTQQTQRLETNRWRYIPAILQHPTTITDDLCTLGKADGEFRPMSVSTKSTRFYEMWAF